MPKLYTPEEVAEELRVTRRSVYEWLRTGRLHGLRAGSRWRIRPEDLQEFLRADTAKGSAAPELGAARAVSQENWEARAARIRAGRGALAHSSLTVDEYLREKREEVERENRHWAALEKTVEDQ